MLEIKIETENSLHCIDRDGDEFNDILGFSEEDWSSSLQRFLGKVYDELKGRFLYTRVQGYS